MTDKEKILKRIQDILQGGELETLAQVQHDIDIDKEELLDAQSFLQGILRGVREFTDVTDEEVNNLDITLDNRLKVSITKSIDTPVTSI